MITEEQEKNLDKKTFSREKKKIQQGKENLRENEREKWQLKCKVEKFTGDFKIRVNTACIYCCYSVTKVLVAKKARRIVL